VWATFDQDLAVTGDFEAKQRSGGLGGGFDALTWEIRVLLNWLEELKAKVPPA
jgi:hypothetical protein